MKMVKSLLLGSAAGLVAISGAQAADLPVKAKPVEYVKICSLYGDGFFYVPGTDTCVRFSGYVRAQYGYNVRAGRSPHYIAANADGALGGTQDRLISDYSTVHRAEFQMDARAQTAYGTIRTYGVYRLENENENSNVASDHFASVPRAFIQWAGWTFGRVKSLSDVPGDFGGGNFESLHQTQNQANSGAAGNNEISYTWELGNGMTLNVGAGERRIKALSNMSAGAANAAGVVTGNGWRVEGPASSRAGQQMPDPYIAFQMSQAWGRFGASLTAVNQRVSHYTAPTAGFPNCPAANVWAAAIKVRVQRQSG